jgi:glycosyltransferase involved in cell wall biosynthesis
MSETQVKTEEQVKEEHNKFVDEVIEKVASKNFKINFYCPPMNVASGGISVLFKNAQILKEAGYNVVMVYEPRLNNKATYDASNKAKKRVEIYEVFNPSWLGDLGEGIELQPLGEGELKFEDGSTIQSKPLTLSPEDFFMIPEGFPNIMEKIAKMPCKKIIIAQSWYYILNSLSTGQKWQHFGIKDVISVSDGITEYLNAIMPGLSIKQYSQSIDRKLFKPVDNVDKNPVIAFMPGRTADAVLKTYNVIKTFYSFFPHLSWVRFDELKGLSKEEYAERLGAASICLYTDEIAGFGTMPLEAMAMGTHVVGWTPLGGKEYMKQNNGFWAQNGDVFQLAELLGMAVERLLTGKLDAEGVTAEYEKTLERYAPEKEKESLINIINEYKNERIAELSQLKR